MNEKSHEEIFEKLRVEPLIGTSLEALKELYQWRDDLARQEDESPSFVLPNRMLLSVCENLPVTTEQLLALCVPVPPLVRAYAHEITAIIHRVRSGVGKAGAARGGYYAIAALLKPKHEEELKLQQQQQKQILAAPQGPFELPVAEAPKPQLHPANRGGAVEGGLFAAAAAQGARQQRKDKVSAALEVIGQSFDPMFASRVAAAFGDDIDEGEVEAEQQTEAPAATAAVSSINEFPKSLAEVHKLSKGQRKRFEKKKKKKKKKTERKRLITFVFLERTRERLLRLQLPLEESLLLLLITANWALQSIPLSTWTPTSLISTAK